LVGVVTRSGAMNPTLEVIFADNTMVILDLFRTHKAASVAQAARDLLQASRSWG
jgi:hypothetical protein